MPDREALIQSFLASAGWGTATRAPLAGDASNRRYERLTRTGTPAVLMDAPPTKGEDVRPFTHLARYLTEIGLSAPAILAEDDTNGLLIIEDLGDDLFSSVTARDPASEHVLYLAATDTLIALHRAQPPHAPDYGPDRMTHVAGLAPDWYLFGATGRQDDSAKTRLLSELATAFTALAPFTPVLVLRDYHAENLLWMPDREAPANVGLLDFQDAGIGHPAYDLMSLAGDARRDVSPDTAAAMIAHYTAQTGTNRSDFARACATLSAQRNLRILGVFARLSMHFGKPQYVDLIPRVWRNLMLDVAHPDLANLRDIITATLPEPSPALLQTLKDKSGTCPMR